jgi:hypothetical protein
MRKGKPWYTAEARVLKKRMKGAERDPSVSRVVVTELRRMYRVQVNADKKRFFKERDAKLRADMILNPKRFWNKFSPKRSGGSGRGAAEWSRYFENLFAQGGSR